MALRIDTLKQRCGRSRSGTSFGMVLILTALLTILTVSLNGCATNGTGAGLKRIEPAEFPAINFAPVEGGRFISNKDYRLLMLYLKDQYMIIRKHNLQVDIFNEQ